MLKAQESMARSSLFSGPTFRSETRKHTSGSVGAEPQQLEPIPTAPKIDGPLLKLIPAKFYFFDPSREEEDELLINPRLVSAIYIHRRLMVCIFVLSANRATGTDIELRGGEKTEVSSRFSYLCRQKELVNFLLNHLEEMESKN